MSLLAWQCEERRFSVFLLSPHSDKLFLLHVLQRIQNCVASCLYEHPSSPKFCRGFCNGIMFCKFLNDCRFGTDETARTQENWSCMQRDSLTVLHPIDDGGGGGLSEFSASPILILSFSYSREPHTMTQSGQGPMMQQGESTTHLLQLQALCVSSSHDHSDHHLQLPQLHVV